MAVFDEPFCALPERPLELDRDELARLDDAAERRLDALAVLFGLLREVEALLRELEALPLELDALLREAEALLPLEDVLRVLVRDALLLGLDPFELREVVFLLLCDFELVWAISPP